MTTAHHTRDVHAVALGDAAPRWQLLKDAQALSLEPLSPARGGYTLTMRECQGAEEALESLEALSAPAGDVTPSDAPRLHVGWGSFRNLDLVAARRSDAALLLDINAHQFAVWQAVRRALQTAPDAARFIDDLVPLLPQPPRAPRLRQFAPATVAGTREWLRGDLQRPGSWLYEGAAGRYRHVRGLFAGAAVAAACLDVRRSAAFNAFATALARARAEEQLALDTVYVSNIPWMLAQPQGFFGEAHAEHADDTGSPVAGCVQTNLMRVVASASRVISAASLRADATPDNLQWQTEVLSPSAFGEQLRALLEPPGSHPSDLDGAGPGTGPDTSPRR